ncbi:MAG: hypothetical protein K8T10_09925 [Candidatus Eremiobacteraeota bacterium]|nr:hypothetical protein [Candidatus Eremiobacteraeota bacterium]
MKKAKVFVLIIAILGFACLWIFGCTGEGVFDVSPEPTGTSTPPPTPSPTGTETPPQPGEETLREYATGRANTFDLRLYQHSVGSSKKYIYWVEKSSTPQGSVFRILSDGSGSVETVVSGLNKPSAMHLQSGQESGGSAKDYLFVSESGTPTNGVIWRVNLTDSGFSMEQLTTGMTGDLIYMFSMGPLFFTRDAGGASSAVHEVDAFPEQTPAIPDDVDSSITNAYGVSGISISDSNDASAPDEDFVFATERIAAPDGKVLMYDLSADEVVYPVTPFEVGSNESMPTKVVFQPIYESDNKTPVYPMEGYVYWTNCSSSSGQLVRQKVKYDNANNQIQKDGTREVVAQSLKFPYDVKVPHDIASGTLKGTLNKVYVSSNISKVQGGNWIEIDVSDSTKFPLEPSDSQVSDLISAGVEFPLNGIMFHTGTEITIYFTSYNDNTGGSNDGTIYYWNKSY